VTLIAWYSFNLSRFTYRPGEVQMTSATLSGTD